MEAELNFLKGQLHPHFLFNTLNNLYALTLKQSPQSPSVVMGLAEILRYMLYEANTEIVQLERDISILKSYTSTRKKSGTRSGWTSISVSMACHRSTRSPRC